MKTSIGKILWEIRFEAKERQKDMAKRLNIPSQYLSAIEQGRKRATEHFVKSVTKEYELPYSLSLALSRARLQSMEDLSVTSSKLSQEQKESLISLFLQLDNISQYDWQKINAIAKRTENAKIATESKKEKATTA